MTTLERPPAGGATLPIVLNVEHPKNPHAFARCPVPRDDLERLLPFFDDARLIEALGWRLEPDQRSPEGFVKAVSACSLPGALEGNQLLFGIYPQADLPPVGYVVLKGINRDMAFAEVGAAILHPAHRIAGYGTLALRAVERFAFEDLGLDKIGGGVLVSNRASMTMNARLGWRKVGEAPWRMPDGSVEIYYLMEITRERFARR